MITGCNIKNNVPLKTAEKVRKIRDLILQIVENNKIEMELREARFLRQIELKIKCTSLE